LKPLTLSLLTLLVDLSGKKYTLPKLFIAFPTLYFYMFVLEINGEDEDEEVNTK